ncbi:MAG: hypothetical protein HQ402_02025, partial [Parcubacteria group bacterium]|nr:hypothetical protein [Parcubacteria group bacterium]
MGRDPDAFAFWHSSQRNDPGLNIALYTNNKVDRLLEEARTTSDKKIQEEKYTQFEKIIKDEIPAVFIYSPEFIYIAPSKIKNIDLGQITSPAERFLNISNWFIDTDHIWQIFSQETTFTN